MKVISFNANGIRAATRKGFFDWFSQQNADFLCIQETKAQFEQLKDDAIYFPEGYHYAYTDAKKKGYSGVAIYAKRRPKRIIHTLGIDWADDEGRYIQFDYEDLSIASIYIPSGSSGDERQAYKMEFLDKYKSILKEQFSKNKRFIICGDVNIVHKEIDIKNWKQNQKTSGVLPEERAWLDHVFGNIGWIDAFRVINQKAEQYTWWSNRGQARAKNVGWRIDYQWITPELKDKVIADDIYTDTWFSDHAPLSITYKI
ncbi:exodeoxyribonuclease III [Cysteiniphilum halobium]|uniref:exodeoxyribonuclease III n=1 Tax=Cysteiniphilum halobium TaxID=2219059 RepID=UPI000E65B15D|nr:exodeoxyribonuclease III [Cysteiniphilum halobium]